MVWLIEMTVQTKKQLEQSRIKFKVQKLNSCLNKKYLFLQKISLINGWKKIEWQFERNKMTVQK